MNTIGIRFLEDLSINSIKHLINKGGEALVLDESIRPMLKLLAEMPSSSLTGVKGVSLEVVIKNNSVLLYFLATKGKTSNSKSIALRFSINTLGIQKAFECAVLKRAELIEHPLLIDTNTLFAPSPMAIYEEAVSKKGIALLEDSELKEILKLNKHQ